MRTVEKKVLPEYFEAIVAGKKKFELRLNDFEIGEGDTLLLCEWDGEKKEYTGRQLERRVTYVGKEYVDKSHWPLEEILEKGLQIISLE